VTVLLAELGDKTQLATLAWRRASCPLAESSWARRWRLVTTSAVAVLVGAPSDKSCPRFGFARRPGC